MFRKPYAVFMIAALALLLSITSMAGVAADGDNIEVRWDIISLQPPDILAGGVASAVANDGSKITMTGDGTFEVDDDHVEGGGTWETRDAGGSVTGSGTYEVEELVQWTKAPGAPPPLGDQIGDPDERSAGLAVLGIRYSDGAPGILVVSCHLVGSPDSIFEGITATKGFVDYFDAQLPVAGVDANRTLFHVDEGGDGDNDDDD